MCGRRGGEGEAWVFLSSTVIKTCELIPPHAALMEPALFWSPVRVIHTARMRPAAIVCFLPYVVTDSCARSSLSSQSLSNLVTALPWNHSHSHISLQTQLHNVLHCPLWVQNLLPVVLSANTSRVLITNGCFWCLWPLSSEYGFVYWSPSKLLWWTDSLLLSSLSWCS